MNLQSLERHTQKLIQSLIGVQLGIAAPLLALAPRFMID
jgi:hypothetical protein